MYDPKKTPITMAMDTHSDGYADTRRTNASITRWRIISHESFVVQGKRIRNQTKLRVKNVWHPTLKPPSICHQEITTLPQPHE